DTYEMPLATREQGGRTALHIWLDFMKNALAGKTEPPFKEPPDICHARVDSRTGKRVYDAVPGSFVAPFRCGTEPQSAPVAGVSVAAAGKRGGSCWRRGRRRFRARRVKRPGLGSRMGSERPLVGPRLGTPRPGPWTSPPDACLAPPGAPPGPAPA